MKSHISKVRIAALAVGLAIVMSSCGIQNQAGDSSSASGKTKNYALVNGYCYDGVDQWQVATNSLYVAAIALEGGSWTGSPQQLALMSATNPHMNPDGTWDPTYDFTSFWAGLYDGVPCPAGSTFAESTDVPKVPLQSNGLPKDCYPQDYIDATIAGFEQQRDKPDATDAYKAEMQKGIDTLKKTCVSK